MTRRIAKNMGGLLSQSISAASGVTEHGIALDLKYVTAPAITGARTAVVNDNTSLTAARDLLRQHYALLAVLHKEMRAFAMLSRETLKPTFGGNYSTAWNAVGFIGSMAVPYKTVKLEAMAETMEIFFTDNPTLELAPRVTAARAGELRTGLSNARTAAELQETVVKNLLKDRNEKLAALHDLIMVLLGELDITLHSMDARWLSFGFPIPGIVRTPEIPVGLIAVLIGANAVSMKWTRATRAKYYRVWKRVVGVDEAFIPVGSPADLDFIMEGLPGNSNVEIAVSAVNASGESAKSVIALVTTL
ncbi:MAG: fibronectin type III domain-containing protein [Verrucomicrobia bacterium]|nr:fibronectin type III domain-containing protein [Verrucomicrobiota bacterium]